MRSSHVGHNTLAKTLVIFVGCVCGCKTSASNYDEPKYTWRYDHPAVAVVDAGIRVSRAAGMDPQWPKYNASSSSERPYEIYALPGETAAFQVVVASGAEGLERVEVDNSEFPAVFGNAQNSSDIFLVHEIPMERRSGGRSPHGSLGWKPWAMPKAPHPPTTIADPLIPVAHAPSWEPYPSRIESRSLRAFWVDVQIPEQGSFPVSRAGLLKVRAQDRLLASIPIRINVGATPLPYASARTMLFFEPEVVARRVGTDEAVAQYLKLIHAHGISSIFPITSGAHVRRYSSYLTGELFSEAHGYVGPGARRAADVVVIGAYGILKDPRPESIAKVEAVLAELEQLGLRDVPGRHDIFLYAVDEECDSPRGRLWREALDHSGSTRLRNLRVGHTCSRSPESQAVDIVMMGGGAYSPTHARRGRQAGKKVWIYNGGLPMTGTFLTDGPTLSLTANGWIQATHRIERWFYWESTFWNDDNKGGLGPYDPFSTAETFHNDDGDHCNGDGVLVYPGHQVQFAEHDLGLAATIPSIRLKQWRRGLLDAAYIELARRRNRAATERILNRVIQGGLDATRRSSDVPWHDQAEAFRAARKALFDLIEGTKD